MNNFIRLSILMLLMSLSHQAFAFKDNIWVALLIKDHAPNVTEYYGQLNHQAFWDIITNKQREGFIRLESAFIIQESGKILPLEEVSFKGGTRIGYGQDAFFLVDSVHRLIPLDDAFIAHYKAEAQKRKK